MQRSDCDEGTSRRLWPMCQRPNALARLSPGEASLPPNSLDNSTCKRPRYVATTFRPSLQQIRSGLWYARTIGGPQGTVRISLVTEIFIFLI